MSAYSAKVSHAHGIAYAGGGDKIGDGNMKDAKDCEKKEILSDSSNSLENLWLS